MAMTDHGLGHIVASHRNLERILDNLKEGIIAHDLNRRILYFNREAEKITGFSRNDVIGKDCHQAFGFPFCGGRCKFDDGAPLPAFDADRYSADITTQSGESRRIEIAVTMMKDENGHAWGVLASFRDVTDVLLLKISAGKLIGFANLVGNDAQMLQIYQQIRDVAAYDYPVHIFGETGTGKELVATAIHEASDRRNAPFVPINCGALPEGLIESELFGHVKGAFSGAIRDKKGRFELADGGTVFLDEVAELSKPMQVKILRFLQEGTFDRVGGETMVTVKVKLISASNKDLKNEVKEGRFREDLFYRLNVIPIHVPPLRQRKTDIPLLIDHFLHQARQRYHHAPSGFSKPALALMMDYQWPGNIRELQNVVQFATVRCPGPLIEPLDLPVEIREAGPLNPEPYRKLDEAAVRSALAATAGNKAKAARLLGVGRATLYRFLNEKTNPAKNGPD